MSLVLGSFRLIPLAFGCIRLIVANLANPWQILCHDFEIGWRHSRILLVLAADIRLMRASLLAGERRGVWPGTGACGRAGYCSQAADWSRAIMAFMTWVRADGGSWRKWARRSVSHFLGLSPLDWRADAAMVILPACFNSTKTSRNRNAVGLGLTGEFFRMIWLTADGDILSIRAASAWLQPAVAKTSRKCCLGSGFISPLGLVVGQA